MSLIGSKGALVASSYAPGLVAVIGKYVVRFKRYEENLQSGGKNWDGEESQ